MNESRQLVIEYLECIQKEYLIKRFGINFYLNQFEKLKTRLNATSDIPLSENLLSLYPGMIEIIKLHNESMQMPLLTKFELPHSYALLSELYKTIETTASKLGMETQIKPYIGTVFSREYNAFAEKVKDTDECLILFEAELFTLANLLAKTVSSCIIETDKGFALPNKKEGIIKHIKKYPELEERFSDLVLNAISDSEPNLTNRYFSDLSNRRLQFELLNSLELFIVGHEYAHIYCGHLNDMQDNWETEYEADQIGLQLLLNSFETNDYFPFSYLGPELFFSFLIIAERGREESNISNKNNIHKKTHPPTVERRERIRNAIRRSIPSDQIKSYNGASEFLENVLEAFWDNYNR